MWKEESFDEPWRDPIVEEIRRIRQEHAARFNYDLDAIVADFKSREQEGSYEVVSLPPRRLPIAEKSKK
ncbi:MAG TPA: hypothetical protein VMY42_13060 [Thermoguttaceae bacterium]|nr:hypothetical protein [Thermoguttaceae bacterium]